MDKELHKVIIPMIRKIVPNLMAQQILSVQPMNSIMRTNKVTLSYWEYHDGVTRAGGTDKYPFVPPKGWSCWAYASHVKEEFEQWVENNIEGEYECVFRYNSGDPMFTVRIVEDEDATLFKLRWDNATK